METQKNTIQTNITMNVTIPNLYDLARRAFYWSSFTPDERAHRIVKEYEKELNEDLQSIDNSEHEQYTSKYIQHLKHWLNSHSRVASSAVTGPSNFPIRRQEKYRNWERSSYDKFREYRERALKAIVKKHAPVSELSILEQAKASLESALKYHEIMKTINKEFKKETSKEAIIALDLLPINDVESLFYKVNDAIGRTGFQSFELTNSNARIKSLTARVKELEVKEDLKTSSNVELEFTGGKVIINFEMDRIQILYDAKPDTDTITSLKRKAFKWSPSQGVWQRKTTINSASDAGRFLKLPILEALRNAIKESVSI